MTDVNAGRWTDGDAYEAYIGRWSRMLAKDFVAILDGVAPQSAWLDVGCGTGALTQAILHRCDPARVDAFDLSPAFIKIAEEKTADKRVSFRVADACALPCADDSFDAVVCGLVLNAVPDQKKALSELVRAAKPGGTVGVYVWDFDGEMQMLRYFWSAALGLDSNADIDRDASGFEICKPDRLKQLLENARLRDVRVTNIDLPTTFRDFDDYWTPFLRGGAPAQTHVASLDDDKRRRLRDKLEASLPTATDGSIPLIARAWTARGVK
jgi:SAM-dependent methyltransferase